MFRPGGSHTALDGKKSGVATAAANLLFQTELPLVVATQLAPTPQVAMADVAWPA